MRERLELRGTESEERLRERMDKAGWEWKQSVHFDKILINDDLQMACDEAVEIVKTHVNSTTLDD